MQFHSESDQDGFDLSDWLWKKLCYMSYNYITIFVSETWLRFILCVLRDRTTL